MFDQETEKGKNGQAGTQATLYSTSLSSLLYRVISKLIFRILDENVLYAIKWTVRATLFGIALGENPS